jgi:predicted ATP-binding protein involved in virulence
MTNKDLVLDDGTTMKWFSKEHDYFLNRTTIIYGKTGSGKSTIIDEIMYLLKDHIAVPFVICQSSITVESSPYYGKIPNNCIKSNVTKEWLETFMENQKGKAALYRTANNINNIKSVFDRIKNNDSAHLEASIQQQTEKVINITNSNPKLDFAEKKTRIKDIENIRDKNLILLYKTTIRKNKLSLESDKTLSHNEKCCVNYLDFNPNAMLIFDDCASKFKTWVRDSTTIKEMIYNGRHYYITQVISAQDDKEIDSELRKNAMVSAFTTQQSATANFERKSNSYLKPEIKRAALCAKRIFSTNDNGKNYKKMIYLQNGDTNPFAYTIANIYDDFRVGCSGIWTIDEKLNEMRQNENSGNAFYNKYHSI